MDIEDLRLRHSVRVYTDKEISDKVVSSLNAAITDVNVHEVGMHFQLITNDSNPFKGLKRSYGMFRNVRNYIACVVDTSYPDYMERGGFFGMKLLMKAFSLGLDTCFVGGTYSADNVEARVRVGEKLLYLITLGYGAEKSQTAISGMLTKMIHRKSLRPEDFLDSEIPLKEICKHFPDMFTALTAVSYAPSAMNKQPVGVSVQRADSLYNPLCPKEKLHVSIYEESRQRRNKYDAMIEQNPGMRRIEDYSILPEELVIMAYVPEKNPMQLIDLGIAMYCFSRGFAGEWEWGNPAVFHPDK